MLKDYYAILNVSQDASLAEIKQQYQRLLLIVCLERQTVNYVLYISIQAIQIRRSQTLVFHYMNNIY